jgi:putative ABC transport system ATP-binding protein
MSTTTQPVPPPPSPITGLAARAIDASKVYGQGEAEVRALDHISVDFVSHQFTAIMGPSGSGKSTLLHCLAGLDRLTTGHVWLGDLDITTLHEKELTRVRRDRLGFIFQTFNLIPTLTALENILLPMSLAGTDPDQAWVDHVIDIVGMRSRLSHRPSELSGGQQQRAAVARALASRPQIVFADEPTGNVDSRAGAEILGFMRDVVHEHGQTIVMVTHDPVAASYSGRVVFLGDGKIVDELNAPTSDGIIDMMRKLGG